MPTEDPVPTSVAPEASGLLERTALAVLRVDVGLVSPRALKEARQLVKQSGDEFDGTALVNLCLEGHAGDGSSALQSALLALRSRVIGIQAAVAGPRKGAPLFVRLTATLTAKLIFFGLFTFLLLILVILVRQNWPAIDIYVISDKVIEFFKPR